MSSSTVSRYRESSAVTSPIKVYDQNNCSFAEDYALDAIAKEAELRLQYQRDQNREARQIRYRELEQNARDININDDEDSPTIPLSSSIKSNSNSSLLQKFLNGDIDLRSIEQRDLRRLLSELETKYKSLMIMNSSMFNEKQSLIYQIDAYKDQLDDHFETVHQIKRQLKDKIRDFELQKQILIDYERNNLHLKETLNHCEQIIEDSEKQSNQEIYFSCQTIDEKLKRILNEKFEFIEEINKLKIDLDEQKTRYQILKEQTPHANDFYQQNENFHSEQQKQLSKEITDLKGRLQRFEAENGILQQENKRYEAQLSRYKQQLEDAERVEEELKQERRRFQRELRTARDELENERTRGDVLQHENTRLRALRKKNLLTNTDDDLLLITTNANDLHLNSPIED